MNKHSYLPIFCILVMTALLHILATKFYLYWDFWWYDILLHFLGGIWIAASSLWIYYSSGYFKNPVVSESRSFMIALMSTLVIGIGWEWFEYVAGLTFVLPGIDYKVDMFCDIGMDIVGALTAYIYYGKS